ncbi:hypothetical protein SGCOL_003133 [Colletotrichum sp. CLE4]
MAPLKVAQLQESRGLDLAKPFDKDTRRILEMTVHDLIRKRGQVDSKMTMALERHGQSSDAQYQQDSLLQLSLREKARERRFIRRQTKVLDDRQKLLDMDPSGARARDVDLLKNLLSKLRDEPSTSSEALKHQSKDGDLSFVEWDTENSEDENDDNRNALDDDLSASPLVPNAKEKRKRDDNTHQSSKKLKNEHGSNDTQPQGEKGQHDGDTKRKKKHKKSKSISLDETKPEKQVEAPKTSSGSNVEHAENTSYGADSAKGQKKKKKSKSATAHLIDHGDEADVGETSFSHQKSEAQNNASSPFTEVKGGKDKKKHKKSHSNAVAEIGKEEQDHSPEVVLAPELFQEKDTPVLTHETKSEKRKEKQKKIKHAEFAHTITVIDDVKEHEQLKVAEASPGSEGAKDPVAFAKHNKSKKEGRISDNTIVKESQANAEPDKSIHDATVAEPTIIEGKKKKKLRSKSLSIAEKDEQATMPDKTEGIKSSIDGPQKATSSPGTALKGPTRIHPPLPPATPENRGSFVRTAGHTPYNPFLNLKPHSVQHPGPSFVREKSPKSAGGQVWVLDTTGSRKKQNKSHEDDTKSVTMTIGKVDTPHKVDQGSPTPPPKKDQKKRGRPKKTKEPLIPASPHCAGFAAQTATPRARTSSDLAALLGSPKRAKKLQKVLKEDRAMLEQEKKSWYEAVGLEYKK